MDTMTPEEVPVELSAPVIENTAPPKPPIPKTPLIIPVVGMLVVFFTSLLFIFFLMNALRKKETKPAPKTAPTMAVQNITPAASASPTLTSTEPTPILVHLPPTSWPLILEISAIGGGASGDKTDYLVNAKLEKTDKIFVIKANDAEITSFPGYLKGATDKGLRLGHGTTYLEIIPSFEGAGYPLPKKAEHILIEGQMLSKSPLYRINSDGRGYVYTTQYSEDPAVCKAFDPGTDQKYEACISGGFSVDTQEAGMVTITCSGTNANTDWCDAILKTLTVAIQK